MPRFASTAQYTSLDRSGSAAAEPAAEGNVSGSPLTGRGSKPTSRPRFATWAKYATVVRDSTLGGHDTSRGHLLPPCWFLPRDVASHHEGRAKKRLAKNPRAELELEPARCGEQWLSSAIFTNMDSRFVCATAYFTLGIMVVLAPALVLSSHRGETGRHNLAIQMHAVGTACLWMGFVHMFHNLRGVVRLRTSWLYFIAAQLRPEGSTEDERAEFQRRLKSAQGLRLAYAKLIADRCEEVGVNATQKRVVSIWAAAHSRAQRRVGQSEGDPAVLEARR